MKKKCIIQIFLMLVPGTIFCGPTDATEARVSLLESRMRAISTTNAHGTFGAKTASAAPRIHGADWFLRADLLWWHLDEGGTDYAQLWKDPPLERSSSVNNRRLTFKWNYGFRTGIGKVFSHDRWDLFLDFTWFETENSNVSSLHGGAFLVPLMQIPLPLKASQIRAHWNLHFYTLDLTLGRDSFVSPQLAFHPFAGIKTAWIDQSARVHSEVFSPRSMILRSKDQSDFWGIGPSLGCEGKWFLDYGFHLFGSAAGAILWGNFDTHHRELSSSAHGPKNCFDSDLHQISPMVQLQIGLGFETALYHDSFHIAVDTCYENQYWWNQNQMPQWTQSKTQRFQRLGEDLSFQGITTHVRFDF